MPNFIRRYLYLTTFLTYWKSKNESGHTRWWIRYLHTVKHCNRLFRFKQENVMKEEETAQTLSLQAQ